MNPASRPCPMTPDEYNQLQELLRLMFTYTVAIVGNPNTPDIHIPKNAARLTFGTGVRLRIKNRLFIITAKHCINPDDRERPVNSTLIAETFDHISIPCSPSKILSRRVHPSRDIGYLEMEDDGRGAAAIGNIADQNPSCDPIETPAGNVVRLYTFVGHPLYENNQSQLLDYLASRPTSHIVAPPPQLTKRCFLVRCLHNGDDQFRFEYPTDDTYDLNPPGQQMTPSPLPSTPEGYSGGGVWNGRAIENRDAIIQPSQMVRLFAIQSRVHVDHQSKSRELSAIPIKHCLQMISTHYPDLRAELAGLSLDIDS
jgi:hypothetical protein